MNYNSNNLYNNYILKNTSEKPYQSQPYPFYSPPSQSSNNINKNNQYNPYVSNNKNFSSTNRSNYNNQDFYSPHSKNSLKWRNIMKIDLPLLQNSRDLNLIQSHLDNLVFGEISEEDIQTLPEVNIVKLIQILQTSCDILLYEQQDLENERDKLENENILKIKEYKLKEKKSNTNKDEICHLKKEKKRDISVLDTYRNAINNLNNGNTFNIIQRKTNITEKNIKRENEEQNQNLNSKKGDFRCQYCPDATFMTEFDRNKHLSEVHGIDVMNPLPKPIQPQIDFQPQINIQFPPEFFNYNNNNANDNIDNEEQMKKLIDMQKNFKETMIQLQEKKKEEERQSNLRNNYGDISDGFQKVFKDTLNDFKSMVEQNKEDDNESNESFENEGYNRDYYANLKMNQMDRLQRELKELDEQIQNQKTYYEKEIEEIKIKQININKKFEEDEIKNSNINSSVIKRQIEYQKLPRKNKIIENEKKYFNSGKLISDHDDTDEELKKQKKIVELYKNEKDIITKMIKKKRILQNPETTVNQNDFFKKDENEKDKEEIQEIMEKDIGKKNIFDSEINLKNVEKKNVKLDKYYKKYKKRDGIYLKEPNEDNYLIETLPKKFDLNPQINDNANNLMKNKVNKIGIKLLPKNINIDQNIEEENLKNENTEDLVMLVNSLITNMNRINSDKDGNENNYYNSIKELLGLDKNVNNAKDIYNRHKENNKNKIINEEKEESEGTIIEKKDDREIKDKDNKNVDKGQANIETGIIINEMNEENILDDINDNKLRNNKLRNKDENKQNFIQNIKPEIKEFNKKPNMNIVEVTEFNKNNETNLNPFTQNNIGQKKEIRNDAHLDAPYTSTNINNQMNEKNKEHPDVTYTSTITNQQNVDNNKNLDSAYTSANIPSPINNNTNGNKINVNPDTNYSSAKMAGVPINNNNNKNLETGYSSARIGVAQENNNNNTNQDQGYSSAQIGAIQENNNDSNLNQGYSSAKIGMPQENLDSGYSSARIGGANINNINNQANNNQDLPYNSSMANTNNTQIQPNNINTQVQTNIINNENQKNNQNDVQENNKNQITEHKDNKEEENYEGEFDK